MPAVDSAAALLKAVIDALKGDAGVAALVGVRVYSDVPQNTPFPNIEVSVQSEPFASQSFSGMSHTVRVQGRSRKPGKKEALDIRAAALAVLDRNEAALAVPGFSLVKSEFEGMADCFVEDDGKTYQSICEVSVLIQ